MPRFPQVTEILLFEDGVALHLIRSRYRRAIWNHIISQSGDTAVNETKYWPSFPSQLEILPLFLPKERKRALSAFMVRVSVTAATKKQTSDLRYGMYFPSPCHCWKKLTSRGHQNHDFILLILLRSIFPQASSSFLSHFQVCWTACMCSVSTHCSLLHCK